MILQAKKTYTYSGNWNYCFENKGNSSVLLEQRFKLIKEGASKHKAKADALIM